MVDPTQMTIAQNVAGVQKGFAMPRRVSRSDRRERERERARESERERERARESERERERERERGARERDREKAKERFDAVTSKPSIP